MTGPVLDRAALAGLAEDLGGALPEVLTLFLRELPRRRDAVVAALEAGDATALERAAHSLKGSSATVCATELADLHTLLEARAAAGEPPTGDEARTLADEVRRAAGRAEAALRSVALDGG